MRRGVAPVVSVLVAMAATATLPISAAAQSDSAAIAQRKALLEMRAQLQTMTRQLNELLKAMGPGPAIPRERPAIMECPWPQPTSPIATADTVAAAEVPRAAGTIDPPRRRIPDCVPPGWTPPAELAPHQPPALAEDRPKPIVEDYLTYTIQPPPPELVARFDLDTTFYRKHADANGYPILGSAKVSDAALAIVRDQVNYLLGHRPDIREEMIVRGGRIVIMAETEYTMDIPEQRNWTVPKYLDPRLTAGERATYYEPGGLASRSPELYWNTRARGMGGTLTSCAEENVLGFYGTRYWGSNICVHEFAHGIMGAGIGNADPQWYQEIVDAYKAAKATCGPDSLPALRTARGYGGNTFNEYWATGLEWYVGNGGRDRRELKATDPRLYELITRLIPEDRELPGRANVANRSRADMEAYVRQRNPEWWQREQQRQQAIAAARAEARGGRGEGQGGGRVEGGRNAPAPQPCVPGSIVN